VCGADVLDLIESLWTSRSSSATRPDGWSATAARTIRQFAAEGSMKTDSGRRHAGHFAHIFQVALASARQLDEAPRPALVASLTREHENFIAAIERARAEGNVGEAAKLSRALHTYWVESARRGRRDRPFNRSRCKSARSSMLRKSARWSRSKRCPAHSGSGASRRCAAGRAQRPLPDMVAGNLRFALASSAPPADPRAPSVVVEGRRTTEADPTRAWSSG
jgi:hypothetical protein